MSAEDTQANSSVDPNLAHCAPDTIDHWWELRCQRKGGDGVTGDSDCCSEAESDKDIK